MKALIAVVLFLAACGGGDDGPPRFWMVERLSSRVTAPPEAHPRDTKCFNALWHDGFFKPTGYGWKVYNSDPDNDGERNNSYQIDDAWRLLVLWNESISEGGGWQEPATCKLVTFICEQQQALPGSDWTGPVVQTVWAEEMNAKLCRVPSFYSRDNYDY